MGKSYTIKYFAHNKNDLKKEKRQLYFGMNISDIIKDFLSSHKQILKGTKLYIWEQLNPLKFFTIQIKQSIILPNKTKYICDEYKNIGLDFFKPIPRNYYEKIKEVR